MPARIEDYALIGDLETSALVSRDGSIDWLCWPNFASSACFAALLGDEQNGRWLISSASKSECTRRYRPGTLILETTFETEQGTAMVIDFMPVRHRHSDIVRLVTGIRGRVAMRMELVLRFEYGRTIPWVTQHKNGVLSAIAGPDMVALRTPVELRGENMHTISDFAVEKGETVPFVLTYGESYRGLPRAIDHEQALRETEEFWTEWIGRSKCDGPYAEVMQRSLITLKALTYRPTGGIVAAPTTSLPEQIGGPRNWDYRYCWLRDATYTLVALMNSGYYQEAQAWRDWLLRAAAGSPDQVQIMYGVRGQRHLLEWEVGWLPGYEGSKPVRVGNAASEQLQLDVYGEVASALYQAHVGGIRAPKIDFDLLTALTEHLAQIWPQPDEGIWEVRGGRQHFTFSKVMAWVAFDRSIKNAQRYKVKAPIEKWLQIRDVIHDEVCHKAWDPELRSFTQAYGSKHLDAALLLLPIVGFLPPTDPRIVGTVDAIQKRLMRDGLLLRYDTSTGDDGLPPGEGSFLACTFWLVQVLNRMGRTEEARRKFEELLTLRNDVGLLSEEYDTRLKRLTGNFPQALSHIALLNAAFELSGQGTRQHIPEPSSAAKSGRRK
jgi:GH15 family glucan-1,4-alpha-glucosidase